MEQKIISAIEKLSRAWRFLLWEVGKKYGLTPLQIQILDYLSLSYASSSSVTKISQEFGLTKATVSSVIKTLTKKKLVLRNIDRNDRRKQIIFLTPSAKALIVELSSWSSDIKKQLAKFNNLAKENTFVFLIEFITLLQEAGIISAARTCINCGNFLPNFHSQEPNLHHCKLLNQSKAPWDLQLDCQAHIPKKNPVEQLQLLKI
ncbi:MAG: MarR family winged helix-turn-helix transcriptional regulator [Omnitrophica bacterium]|nr:MarR family winged helix-turn-helix transcriptional regulator [Candidatus Omnitrophota bacterium]